MSSSENSVQNYQNNLPPPDPGFQPGTPDKHNDHVGNMLLYVAIGCVLFFLCTVWYGYTIRNQAFAQIQATDQKLRILEQHDISVQQQRSDLQQQIGILEDPINTIAFWHVQRVADQVEDLNTTVDDEYEHIKGEQKSLLADELVVLEQKLDLYADLSLPSKTEVQIFVQQLSQQMTNDSLSVSQMKDYRQSSIDRRKQLQQETVSALEARLTDLEDLLEEHNGIAFPSKEETIAYMNSIQEELDLMTLDDDSLLRHVTKAENYLQTVESEGEETKRQTVLATIESANEEAKQLSSFFQQRQGYDASLEALSTYQSRATTFFTDEYADTSSDDLQKEAEEQLFPLLVEPRQAKAAIEEEERKALIARQRQSGIPPAPMKEGKVILISVPSQRLYAYENGVSLFDYPVPITTGKAGYDTVRGSFAIYHKATNFRLRSPFPDVWYDNIVSYWMPFHLGYGIHDAYWRSVYGTQDYSYVGSHGCVNTPFAEVERLYYWADIGTPVIVQ
jgi:lipoprotein-anchoring transpeptidase ErfK/SrfK